MPENEIHIKCRLCDQFHAYEFHTDHINAITAHWKRHENPDLLLESRPLIDHKYLITLFSSLNLKTDQPFWVLFQNPGTVYNGIENEEDLKALCVCKCEYQQLYKLDEFNATIEINVMEIKELNALTATFKPAMTWWSLFTDEETFKNNGRTENFNHYSFISINVQSDLGIDLIIWKENGKSSIIAANDWDFHLNEWHVCHIPLTKEQEEKYNIVH